MRKFSIFAFNGNLMCFMHTMLNALDLDEKGYEVTLIIEGEAVKLIEELQSSKNPLFKQMVDKDLIFGVCKACSAKLGVLEYNQNSGVKIVGDMNGHPSMTQFIEKGFEVITL